MPGIEVISRGVCVRNQEILLCKNIKHGYYYLPGGHVEFGESAGAALVRELEEESAQKVRVDRCILVTEASFSTKKRRHHEVNLVFLMELESEGPVRSAEPKIGFEWVRLNSIPGIDIRPHAIQEFLAEGAIDTDLKWVSEIGSSD